MESEAALQAQILELLKKGPCTAHHCASMLTFCLYRVWRALKDLESRGLVYHRRYPVRWPSGAEHLIKVFFPAGLADGMPFQRGPDETDLVDRLAARTIQECAQRQRKEIRAMEELGASLRTK